MSAFLLPSTLQNRSCPWQGANKPKIRPHNLKKLAYRKLCAQISFFVFKAKISKKFVQELSNLMAQWPIFYTKMAEKFCLEFATLGDATLRAS
jgi:hypothetical protein